MADRSHECAPESFVQGAVKPQFGEVRIRSRGRLPHWEKEDGLYFITFHLDDSLSRGKPSTKWSNGIESSRPQSA
jgi:hypothetical protein